MALDIGMATGLAYKHDFQKDIRNRSMIQQLKRQKRIDNQSINLSFLVFIYGVLLNVKRSIF